MVADHIIINKTDLFTGDMDEIKTFFLELQKTSPRTKGHSNLADGRIVSVNQVYDFLELKELKNHAGPTEFVAFG